jgi:hypothetical protein
MDKGRIEDNFWMESQDLEGWLMPVAKKECTLYFFFLFSVLKIHLFHFTCTSASMCTRVNIGCLWRSEEGTGTSATGVRDGCGW